MRRRILLIGLMLTLALTAHWLIFQPRELVPGVVARPLGSCDLDWHAKQQMLILACPHTDLIRIWPLPVILPWCEDPIHPASVA